MRCRRRRRTEKKNEKKEKKEKRKGERALAFLQTLFKFKICCYVKRVYQKWFLSHYLSLSLSRSLALSLSLSSRTQGPRGERVAPIIDRLDESNGGHELSPPVTLFPSLSQRLAIVLDVLLYKKGRKEKMERRRERKKEKEEYKI